MSITKISLQNLATRLIISPAPTTLGESTAIVKKLQSFGHVISFIKANPHETRQSGPASDNEQLEMNVVFSSRETILKAQAASPFTVRVNYDLPDPKVEDPYNVRNLQSRKQPKAKTMICRLEDGADPPSGQNIFSTGFSPSVKTRLYQSLVDLNPPPGVAAALGVFHTATSHVLSTADLVDKVPDLMEMYRSQSAESTESDQASSNGLAAGHDSTTN